MEFGPINPSQVGLAQPVSANERLELPSESIEKVEEGFDQVFLEMVSSANSLGKQAHRQAEALASGASDDIHGTMIAMSKAGVEMRLVTNMKNKIVDAFHELWRMQI